MKRKRLFRAALFVITLTFGSVILPTTSASAANVYGNVIIEGYGSTANLLVVSTGSSTFKQMKPNTRSDNWPAFAPNVRVFYVPPGYVAVNGYTGYGYGQGWHYFSTSYNTLYLLVETEYCWYLRSQLGTPCKIPVPA